jgi:hypothetical protein
VRVPDEHVEPALKELAELVLGEHAEPVQGEHAEPVQEEHAESVQMKHAGTSPVRYSQGWCVGPRGPDTRRRTGSDGTDGNSVSACSALVDLRNDA